MNTNWLGKFFIITGVVIIAMGILLILVGNIPGVWRLPGDIYIKKGNFTFYFHLTTSILLSVFLILLFCFLSRR